MPAEDFDPPVDDLSARFGRAEVLIAGILGGVAAGATASELAEAATRVARVLEALLADAVSWINRNVPEVYRAGAEEAARSMALETPGEVARSMMRSEAHRADLDALAQGLLDDIARGTDNVAGDAKKALREIARRQRQKALARGNPLSRVGDFRAEMEERGIRFVDRSGRRWRMAPYARTVLLTHTATILNAGALNAALELGSPGVRVSDGGPGDVDGPCERADGQAWTVPYALANPIEHPNCRRAFAPLPRSYAGGFDRGEAA